MARGFEVSVKVYSIGGGNPCPSIPSSLPTTIAELDAMLACKSLPCTSDTKVWCAKVTSCATGEIEPEGADYEVRQLADGQAVLRLGDPIALLGGPVVSEFRTAFAASQVLTAEDLPPALGATWTFHPPLAGISDIVADVEQRFEGVPGIGTVVNAHRVAGVLLAGGRFSITDTRRVLNEDQEGELLTEALAFDGGNFFRGIVGTPCYDAYTSSSPGFARAALGAAFVEHLAMWVDSPFAMLRIAGAAHIDEVVSAESPTRVRVTQTYPGVEASFDTGRSIYDIDIIDGVAHPVRIEVTDTAGQLLWRREFADYRTLGPDIWRPFRVVDQRFTPGATEPHLTTTMSIRRVKNLTAEAAATAWQRPSSDNNWWWVRN